MLRRQAKFHDIGRSREAADFFANELERLMALPLSTKSDVEQWYAERDKTEKVLKERFSNFEFWHEVWHFLLDPDVRAPRHRLPRLSAWPYERLCGVLAACAAKRLTKRWSERPPVVRSHFR